MDRIIVKAFGGLGNQMFQHAAGRALSTRLQCPLEVDFSQPAREGAAHNGFELDRVFKLKVQPATRSSVAEMLTWRRFRPVQRILRRSRSHWLAAPYIFERHFHHWREFDQLSPPCYLDGYWQSYRYFEAVSSLVREDYGFREPLAGQNLELAGSIASVVEAVSIHVRRGDYVTNPKAAAHHGCPGIAYYTNAIGRLQEQCRQPRFFVFSDDISWTRANLVLPQDTVFVDHNRGADSHFDMQLMARCRHHIIANSSFSWWGAWLSQGTDQTVIAPREWVKAKYDTTTLTPSHWQRI